MSIKLYRGDSTDFSDQREIKITLTTPFTLVGCSATFTLQGITKTTADVSGGEILLVFSSAETATLALGECFGNLRIFDGSGRVKTVANEIPFEIVQTVVIDETDTYSVTVTLDSGDVLIEVTSTLGYIGEAPVDGQPYVRQGAEWVDGENLFPTKLGTEFAVTGWEELKTADISSCTDAQLRDIVGTLIDRLS